MKEEQKKLVDLTKKDLTKKVDDLSSKVSRDLSTEKEITTKKINDLKDELTKKINDIG